MRGAGDFTYIYTLEGFVNLATVMDVFGHKMIGWSIADHARADLLVDGLNNTLLSRKPSSDLILHSDRGVQYASRGYRALLASNGIRQSMSRKGNYYDNAVQESFYGKFKTEWMPEKPYATRSEAGASVFAYIEMFYNRKRVSSALGFVSPGTFEANQSA